MNQKRVDLIIQKINLEAVKWYFDNEELKFIKDSLQELAQLREEIKNHECLELQCPLCDGSLIVDDCVEHCVYCNSDLKHKFVLEDKSLRAIVQALRELMPTKNQIKFSEKTPNANLATILKIQSILASDEVKE